MCLFLLKSFFLIIVLQLVLCQIDEKFLCHTVFREYFYTIHPLVILVDENKQKSLVQHDKLDQNGMLTIKPQQKVMLYCSGYNNVLATNSKEYLDIYKDKPPAFIRRLFRFRLGKFNNQKLNEIRCLSPSLATTNNNKYEKKCGTNNRGTIIPAGFYTSKYDPFFDLYTICFRTDNMSAIYSSHQLLGSELLFPEKTEFWKIPMTRKTKMLTVSHLASPYYPKTQMQIFSTIFGPELTNWYMSFASETGTLFTAAPLTPPGDFYHPPIKTATHLYENTVPVFTNIFISDWFYIQILGRILALQVTSKSLKVYTGAFGLLSLPDENGRLRSIYLDSTRSGHGIKFRPIPKFLYKIYYDEKSKKGIAFVTINNPFNEFNVYKDFPCHHIGKEFVRMDYFSTDKVTRNTIYCRVDDLMNHVKDFPTIDVSAGHLYLNIYDKRFSAALTQLPPGVPVF